MPKVIDLPNDAILPLTGDEQVAIDQGDDTKRVDVSELIGASLSASRNLADPDGIRIGFEVLSTTGEITAVATSVLSPMIDCEHDEWVRFSGLPDHGTNERVFAWRADDGATLVFHDKLPGDYLSGALEKPKGARYLDLDYSHRQGTGDDYSAVQIELGYVETPFTAFEPDQITALHGRKIAQRPRGPRIKCIGNRAGNLYNKNTNIPFHEMNANGLYTSEETSSVSEAIWVGDLQGQDLFLSGMPTSTKSRFCNFYKSADFTEANQLGYVRLFPNQVEAPAVVPVGALYFVLTTKYRGGQIDDFSQTQLEIGTAATAYKEFEPVTAFVDGQVLSPFAPPEKPIYSGGDVLNFSDSIGKTAKLPTGGVFLDNNPTENYPSIFVPKGAPDNFYTFGIGGAQFASYDSQGPFLAIEDQVDEAISYCATNNINPRAILIHCGTNDIQQFFSVAASAAAGEYGGWGDYDTAMAKPISFSNTGVVTTDLDKTITLESLRLELLKLRYHFPTSKIIFSSPLQRAQYTRAQMEPLVDDLIRMAGAYGCDVADGFRRCDIVREFETLGQMGRKLADGLHPYLLTGTIDHGNLIVTTYKTAMNF